MAFKWDLAVIGSGIVGLSSTYHIMNIMHFSENLSNITGNKQTRFYHTCGYLYLIDDQVSKSGTFLPVLKRSRSRFLDRDDLSTLDSLRFNPEKDQAEIMGLKNIDKGFLGENCGIIEPDRISRL